MRKILSDELLDAGTKVQVQSLIGTVLSAQRVPGYPCGWIALHKIKFTHRIGNDQRQRLKELDKPIIKSPNYSFIYILEQGKEN